MTSKELILDALKRVNSIYQDVASIQSGGDRIRVRQSLESLYDVLGQISHNLQRKVKKSPADILAQFAKYEQGRMESYEKCTFIQLLINQDLPTLLGGKYKRDAEVFIHADRCKPKEQPKPVSMPPITNADYNCVTTSPIESPNAVIPSQMSYQNLIRSPSIAEILNAGG